MEIVREYVDADRLSTVIALPESFKNQRVEVLVLPLPNQETKKKASDISSTIRSLVGAIPSTPLSLEELRSERLQKYEAPN